MKLILKHFGKVIKESLLEEGREYFIGRHEECDFVLEGETGLSRKHIRIYQSDETGNWIVETLSVLGGLYLDGEEIESVELEGPGALALKNYILDFVIEEQQEVEESQPLEEPLEEPAPNDHQQPDVLDDKTTIFSDSSLIYSIYIYISGEFSDHIKLNSASSWVVGRSEGCDISIDYSVLTRKHFQILRKEESFYVKDLASSNRTFLNGKELEPHKEEILRANDEISISDLKIIFEVRDKNYEKRMNSLPVSAKEDSHSLENPPEMAFPKVILETASPEKEKTVSFKSKMLNPKRVILIAVVCLALGFGLYAKHTEDQKKKKQQQAEREKEKDQMDKLEVFYKQALANLEKQEYQLCIDQLEELGEMSGKGYFKESQQILNQCQTGLENQRQKEEYLAQEKIKQETEKKIKAMASKCEKEYAENKIQTVEELNHCAEELLSLDPANAEISSIRLQIEEKASLKALEEQKKMDYQKFIQSKKSLYYKAKRIRDQNKPLKAVSAYNVFLKSSRKTAGLKKLRAKATSERDEIQNKYDTELNQLYQSCESFIQKQKMKEAYYDCRKILEFKSEDQKAKKYIQQALLNLRKEFKPLYEKSMQHESLSQMDEAKKIWREILDKDIKGGYYYKKASAQLSRYK